MSVEMLAVVLEYLSLPILIALMGALAGYVKYRVDSIERKSPGSIAPSDNAQGTSLLGVTLLAGICGATVAVALASRLFQISFEPYFLASDEKVAGQMELAVALAAIAIVGGFVGITLLKKLEALVLQEFAKRLEANEAKAQEADQKADAAQRVNLAQDLIEAAKEVRDDLRTARSSPFSEEQRRQAWTEVANLCVRSLTLSPTLRAYLIHAQALARLDRCAEAQREVHRALDIANRENAPRFTFALIYWNLSCYLALEFAGKQSSIPTDKQTEIAKTVREHLEKSLDYYPPFQADLKDEKDLDALRTIEPLKGWLATKGA